MTVTRFNPLLLILFLLCLAGLSTQAQPLSPTMSRKQHKAIVDRAKATFTKYIQFMNSISAPESELPGDELDLIIDNAFSNDQASRIFFGNEWQTDKDEEGANPEKADEAQIKPYLQAFRNDYKARAANSITGKLIEEPKNIYIGKDRYFLRLYFRQTMNGTNFSGEPFPQQTLKYMDLQVLQKNKEFQTLISKVGFTAKASTRIDAAVVKIEDAFNIGLNDRVYSPAYYERQLEDGRRSLADQRFDEAYVSLKNAQKGPMQEAEASRLINGVYDALRAKKQVAAEYLFEHLTAKAEMYREKYRYEESRRYFEYAIDVKPPATNQVLALEGISKKEKELAVLEELLRNKVYQQAIQEYSSALKKEPDNPQLIIGLARASMALQNYKYAERLFNKAIQVAPTYSEIYRYQAEFYARQNGFSRAYDALRLAQGYTDDPGDPELLSNIAYYKGAALWLKRQPEALDSLRAAVEYLESNIDAQIAMAEVMNEKGDSKEAEKLIRKILRADLPPASAYWVSGKINQRQDHRAEAVEDFTKATRLSPDDIRWQYEFSEILMDQDPPRYPEIMAHLNEVADDSIKVVLGVEQLEAYKCRCRLLRARCNYFEERNSEAKAGFEEYFKSCAPIDMAYASYALLLIRMDRQSEARTEIAKVKAVTPTPVILLANSVIAFLNHDPAYEDLFEDAINRGLKKYEILSAPKMEAMAHDSKKIRDLLKARRNIKF